MKKNVFIGQVCKLATVTSDSKITNSIQVTARNFIVPNTTGIIADLLFVTKIGRLGVGSVPRHMKAELKKKLKNVGQSVRIHTASIELLQVIPEWDIFGEYKLIQRDDIDKSDKLICLFKTFVEEDTPLRQRFIFPDKNGRELDLVYQESNEKIGRQAYARNYEHSFVAVLNKGATVRFDRRCLSDDFLREHRMPAIIYYMWTGKELVYQTIEERERHPQYFSNQKLY